MSQGSCKLDNCVLGKGLPVSGVPLGGEVCRASQAEQRHDVSTEANPTFGK